MKETNYFRGFVYIISISKSISEMRIYGIYVDLGRPLKEGLMSELDGTCKDEQRRTFCLSLLTIHF